MPVSECAHAGEHAHRVACYSGDMTKVDSAVSRVGQHVLHGRAPFGCSGPQKEEKVAVR